MRSLQTACSPAASSSRPTRCRCSCRSGVRLTSTQRSIWRGRNSASRRVSFITREEPPVNVLFGCQGRSLDMFHQLADTMRAQDAAIAPAYYVADSLHFGGFSRNHPDVLDAPLLKEWEIMSLAAGRVPSAEVLARLNADYGDPTIWNTLLCDRRLVYGPLCTLRQDYRRRFTDAELLAIVETGYEQDERFLDRVRQIAVVKYIC